jgi:DNA-binding HxlR family transcriptional regulator
MTDWITQQILKELDSEKTTTQIADAIGLDTKVIYSRLCKLEKHGKVEKTIIKKSAWWKK